MDKSTRDQYRNLRKSRGVMILFARITLIGANLLGALWFGHHLYVLLTGNQMDSQRIWTSVFGLVGLAAFVMGGVILHRLLHTTADVIDVLMDAREEAARAADVVENQLLPIVFSVERLAGMPEAQRVERWAKQKDRSADDALSQAYSAVRDALQREWWHQAERLANDLRRQFPDSEPARGIDREIAEAKSQRKAMLFEQAEAAGRRNDWDALTRVRDRLSAFAGDSELHELDNEIAKRLLRVRADMEKTGRKREAGRLAVHLAEAFAETDAVRRALDRARRP